MSETDELGDGSEVEEESSPTETHPIPPETRSPAPRVQTQVNATKTAKTELPYGNPGTHKPEMSPWYPGLQGHPLFPGMGTQYPSPGYWDPGAPPIPTYIDTSYPPYREPMMKFHQDMWPHQQSYMPNPYNAMQPFLGQQQWAPPAQHA